MILKIKEKIFKDAISEYSKRLSKYTNLQIIEVDSNKKVIILYEVIETAPGEETIIDGIKYQKNLKTTGKVYKYMKEYIEILEHYKAITGIEYEIRYQNEFNNASLIASTGISGISVRCNVPVNSTLQ